MYAAIRRYQVKPGALDLFRRGARPDFADVVSEIPGYVAYYGVVLSENEVATISIFEDQAGEEESNRRAGEWVRQNAADLFLGPPEIMAGEVEWQGMPARVGALV